MTQTDIQKLQNSIDHLHTKLTTVYSAIMTADIDNPEKRIEFKNEIGRIWNEEYIKAKNQ